MIYVEIMVVTFLLTLLVDSSNKSTEKGIICRNVLWYISCFPIVFLSMIRFNVGTDYLLYVRYFNAVAIGRNSIIGSTVEIDKGLFYFNKLLQLISDSSLSFFVASSIIIYFSIFIYIRRTSIKIALPTLFFMISGLYFNSLNVIRQFLAFSVILISWNALQKRKDLLYILGCLIASVFHLSVLIFIPVYIVRDININRRRFVRGLFYIIICMPLISLVAQKIIRHTRYRYYLNSILYKVDIDITGIIYAILISTLVIILFDRVIETKNGKLYCWMLLAYDATMICSLFIPLTNRMSLYFKFFVFVNLLPMTLDKIKNSRKKMIITCVVVLFLFVTAVYLYGYRGLSNVIPYTTIWS